MCSNGFTLATGDIASYWATDLLHRSLHMPSIGSDAAEHAAEGYSESVELAAKDPEAAAKNSDSLMLFAFDVFVRTHLDPQGCVGEATEESKSEDDAHSADAHAGHDHGNEHEHEHTE